MPGIAKDGAAFVVTVKVARFAVKVTDMVTTLVDDGAMIVRIDVIAVLYLASFARDNVTDTMVLL
jgi:hypothetical protein